MPRTRYTARYQEGDGWRGYEASIEVFSDDATVRTDELIVLVRDMMDEMETGAITGRLRQQELPFEETNGASDERRGEAAVR